MNSKKYVKILSAILSLSCLCGCAQTATAPTSPTVPTALSVSKTVAIESVEHLNDDFVKATSNASIALLKEAVSSSSNCVVSPASLLYAMGMAANGADGETFRQISAGLFNNLGIDAINSNLARLMANAKNSEYATFDIANSLWVRDKYAQYFNQDYIDTVSAVYDAEVFSKSFDKSTVGDVNSWVSAKTQGMLPDILDSLDADSRALLINALYFKSKWAEDYEESQIDENWDFKSGDSISKCTMLRSNEDGHYLTDGKIDACYKYYKDPNYVFLGMYARDENTSISDILDYLDGNKLFDLWHSGSNNYTGHWSVSDVEVTCRIPEFETETEVNLNDMLKNLGVTDAFDADKANLYNMYSKQDEVLYISSALQKAKIKVNREGTEAAAATTIGLSIASAAAFIEEPPHITINFDRPFIYAIVDTNSGTPIFMGVVNKI